MTYQPSVHIFQPRKPVTAEEDDRIRQMHEAGQTPQEIGDTIGRAHPIIYRRLRAMGYLPPVKHHRNPRPIQTADSDCRRCSIRIVKTPRPSARGLCCYCLEEGH